MHVTAEGVTVFYDIPERLKIRKYNLHFGSRNQKLITVNAISHNLETVP